MKRQYLPLILIASLSLLFYACSDSGNSVGPGINIPMLTIGDITVVEGDTAIFTVNLSGIPDSSVVFQYSTVDGSAVSGTDFVGVPSANGLIPNRVSTFVIKVGTINNLIADGTRQFSLQISSVVGIAIGDVVGLATITDDEAPGISYAAQVKPILSSRCAISNCHGSGASSGGFTMGAGAPYNIVRTAVGNTAAIIVAGNASSSNLYLKTKLPPPFGSQMPLNGPKLSVSDQLLIRDWINGGALDN